MHERQTLYQLSYDEYHYDAFQKGTYQLALYGITCSHTCVHVHECDASSHEIEKLTTPGHGLLLYAILGSV